MTAGATRLATAFGVSLAAAAVLVPGAVSLYWALVLTVAYVLLDLGLTWLWRNQLAARFGRRWRWAAGIALVILLLAATPTLVLVTPPGRHPVPEPSGTGPVRMVLLADESGSLSPADVYQEQLAVRRLAQGTSSLDDGSRIAVVGFGSSDADGQNPTDDLCQPSPPGDPAFGACIANLERRGPRNAAESTDHDANGTDFVAALGRATSILDGPDSADIPRLIILLTDGHQNVSNSPGYGSTPEQRNSEALARLTSVTVPKARRVHAQIWPVGFGGAADKDGMATLATLASGGYQPPVDSGCPRPVARNAQTAGSAQFSQTVADVLAVATCNTVDQYQATINPATGKATATVPVSLASSSASIDVIKPVDDTDVSFIDPDNHDVTTAHQRGGSTFELVSGPGRTESLRISRPRAGSWTVKLSMPPGTAARTATVTLVSQSRLTYTTRTVPSQPSPGEYYVIQARLTNLRGVAVPDQELPEHHEVVADVRTGNTSVQVTLVDDGIEHDQRKHDGIYTAGTYLSATARDRPSVTTHVVDTRRVMGDRLIQAAGFPSADYLPVGEGPRPWYDSFWYRNLLPVALLLLLVPLWIARGRVGRRRPVPPPPPDEPTPPDGPLPLPPGPSRRELTG
ncbi:vWA domain-containing protein [Frankia sp. AgB32]|uniref:vWA domain-containing protein n=1 Tax=Frankia sp. AgB32 TaxID=631119 RepID=UPI002010A01F|nr:vWA domain-containing protein [Frankia sp. AgB32]MCK9893639.1 VWA domain-containing protein [Frankia sp. AgB32]